MLFHRTGLLMLGVAASLLLGSISCIFDPEPAPPPIIPPDPIPPPTSPENLVAALQVIYDDEARTAQERREEYANLLPLEGFKFRFQPADVGTDPGGTGVRIPPDWGRDPEIASHERLFTAQENGAISSLELDILHGDAEPIDEVGKEGWERIFASNVFLRLMFTENDGLEVNGGQAEFDCAPDGDPGERWYIGEWTDLPRP